MPRPRMPRLSGRYPSRYPDRHLDASDLEPNQSRAYLHPISTGPLEATNTKIQFLKRQAYGYRDEEFFHLKIYALHLTKYALVG